MKTAHYYLAPSDPASLPDNVFQSLIFRQPERFPSGNFLNEFNDLAAPEAGTYLVRLSVEVLGSPTLFVRAGNVNDYADAYGVATLRGSVSATVSRIVYMDAGQVFSFGAQQSGTSSAQNLIADKNANFIEITKID